MDIRFGSSGIRGKYPQQVNSTAAFDLARRLVKGMGTRVALGRDPRLSGPVLRSAFITSALEEGAEIVDYDIIPTPALSYETRASEASFGVMITASHNPPEYNGFKIFSSNGEAVERTQRFAGTKPRMSENGRRGDPGLVRPGDTFDYFEKISEIKFQRNWKVVLDPGNGAACGLAAAVYRRTLGNVSAINSLPDGKFPARGSEPTTQSMELLSKVVVETKADAGIGFDGDGDRMFIVDEKGGCPLQDRVLGFYISALARQSKGPFLIPVDASMAIDEIAERYGSKVVRGPVGDARLLREMKSRKAKFAGEPSGAWIHADFNPCPDGLLSGLRYLKAVEELGPSVSKTLEAVPLYHMMRKSLALRSKLSHKMASFLGRRFKEVLGKDSLIDLKYGLRVSTDRSWLLVRESGTEPVLRVTGESKDRAELVRIMRYATTALSRVSKSRTVN